MTKHFAIEQMDFSSGRPICPDCKNHEQITDAEFNVMDYSEQRQLDCKNTFGLLSSAGQCCCYSVEHK